MAIQGLRDTSNFVTDQRPKNWREGIMLVYPNGAFPLFALTSMMKKRRVDDPEFYWWEKDMQTRRLALTANITTTTTGFTFASGALGFKEGDLFYIEESGEIVAVTADPSADTGLTVQRGYAGSTPAAVTLTGTGVNPNIMCIGSAFEEGSSAPTGVGFDPNKKYNYTQIFRDAIEATRTAMKTRLRTGDQVKEAKRECLEIHSAGIERAMWFGNKTATTKNGKPLHTMDGIHNQIVTAGTNVLTPTSAASGVMMSEIEDWMEQIFRKGSNEKMVFCGNRFLLGINQAIRKNSAYQFTTGEKEHGMNVSRLISPFGELVCKTHPLFNQMTGGTSGSTPGPYYGVNTWGFVLDMANIQYVYFDGDDTRYETDLQIPGVDGKKSGYLTECSLELDHLDTHFVIKNVNTGRADA